MASALLCAFAISVLGGAPARSEPAFPSLVRLSREVAEQVVAQRPEPPVALQVRATPPDLARGAATQLAAELARAKLAPLVLTGAGAEPDAAEAAARAAGARSLLRLTVSVEKGQLQAKGDLLGTWVNFWSGKSPTRPAHPAALLDAATEADPALLALAEGPTALGAAPGPLKLQLLPFARLSAVPAAVAVGELDGDGSREVAVLTDDEVLVYKADGRLLARYEHRGLSAAEAPCREPFGALAFVANPPRLAYVSGRRARGELLAYERGALRALGNVDETPATAFAPALRLEPGLNVFRGKQPFAAAALDHGWSWLVLADTSASIARPAATGRTWVTGAGAGTALADLDGDGLPEVVLSAPRYQADPDELRVVSATQLEARGQRELERPRPDVAEVPSLWQGTVGRGRAVVMATGALEPGDAEQVVVGLWQADGAGELVLLRRQP